VGPSTADSGFVPILPNPYIVGYPVRDPAMFFGRETEFELVRKRFKERALRPKFSWRWDRCEASSCI